MGKDWDNFSGKSRSYIADDIRRDTANKLRKGGKSKQPFSYSPSNALPTKQEREAFIAFMTEVMSEVYRVLKPGAHGLVWSLPRTSHWTALALEDAGFEIRDCIYHIFGSGFPKSLDVSKAIDKLAGAEREIIGEYQYASRKGGKVINAYCADWGDRSQHKETAPATPAAQQYAGYGSALKPAVECWWLVRKPLSEKSIAENVLRWNTGAINVDGCRIGTTQNDLIAMDRHKKPTRTGWIANTSMPDTSYVPSTQGRWPSHLLLSHSIWCIPRGTKQVRSQSGGNVKAGERHGCNVYRESSKRNEFNRCHDDNYMETVEDWDCDPSCPIAELDRQSGVRRHGDPITEHGNGIFHKDKKEALKGREHLDTGGASRYFQSFIYTSKTSRRERNAGCEELPARPGFDKNTSQHIAHVNHETGETTYSDYQPSSNGNNHPTVKPISLMSYLVRLITPPNGIVLDPFGGSGSTALACIQEGFRYLLIEREADYCQIAQARIAHALKTKTAS